LGKKDGFKLKMGVELTFKENRCFWEKIYMFLVFIDDFIKSNHQTFHDLFGIYIMVKRMCANFHIKIIIFTGIMGRAIMITTFYNLCIFDDIGKLFLVQK